MQKMKLDLDALVVESFDTDGEGGMRGTVRANTGESCTCPTPVGYCLDTDPNNNNGGGGTVYPQWTCDWLNCGFSRAPGTGCSAFPCQSVNACKTDQAMCPTPVMPCTNHSCPLSCAGDPGCGPA